MATVVQKLQTDLLSLFVHVMIELHLSRHAAHHGLVLVLPLSLDLQCLSVSTQCTDHWLAGPPQNQLCQVGVYSVYGQVCTNSRLVKIH